MATMRVLIPMLLQLVLVLVGLCDGQRLSAADAKYCGRPRIQARMVSTIATRGNAGFEHFVIQNRSEPFTPPPAQYPAWTGIVLFAVCCVHVCVPSCGCLCACVCKPRQNRPQLSADSLCAHWEADGRASLPLQNPVSDSANPHYISDPLPQPLWDHRSTGQL